MSRVTLTKSQVGAAIGEWISRNGLAVGSTSEDGSFQMNCVLTDDNGEAVDFAHFRADVLPIEPIKIEHVRGPYR